MVDEPSHSPNQIPAGQRFWLTMFALGMIGYGAWGLWGDGIYIPGKRGDGMTFVGAPAWLLFAAMLVASASAAIYVLDHYDRRNNEALYQRWRLRTSFTALGLFFIATFWQAYNNS